MSGKCTHLFLKGIIGEVFKKILEKLDCQLQFSESTYRVKVTFEWSGDFLQILVYRATVKRLEVKFLLQNIKMIQLKF